MLSPHFASLADELLAFLVAATCAGCDARGSVLCASCRSEIEPAPRTVRTPDGLKVETALAFAGVASRCIRRLKGEGETLLARPLGQALGRVLTPELAASALVVPVPTSRGAFRRRGYRVPEMLIRRAGAVPVPLLRGIARPADQRGLDVEARAANVRNTMRARRGDGQPVVLVDDVVTTGATLDEAARALRDAGFRVISGVTLAATPRRGKPIEDSSATRGR